MHRFSAARLSLWFGLGSVYCFFAPHGIHDMVYARLNHLGENPAMAHHITGDTDVCWRSTAENVLHLIRNRFYEDRGRLTRRILNLLH